MNCVVCEKELSGLRRKFCSKKCDNFFYHSKYTKEQIKKINKAYYENNREKAIESHEKWRRRNWDYYKAFQNERYASDIEYKEKKKIRAIARHAVKKLKNVKCVKCGSVKNLEAHHPHYSSKNYVLLCKPCHGLEHGYRYDLKTKWTEKETLK